ncbi:MAG: hypothetical protein Kow0068_17810 [Marinilabiliales bacterium]
MKWFYILVFLSVIQIVKSQDVEYYVEKLNTVIDDSAKIELLLFIGDKYADNSTEKALEYYNKAQKLSLKYNNAYLKANCYLKKGLLYKKSGDNNAALNELTKGLKLAKTTADKYLIMQLLKNTGDIYNFWNKYYIAIDHYLEALKYADELEDEKDKTHIYLSLGRVYHEIEDRTNSLKYYGLAKKNAEITRDTISLIYALNNIGNVYYKYGAYEKAIEYYELSLQKNENLEDAKGQAVALSNLGFVNIALGNYKKAMELLNASQKLSKSINDIELIINNIQGIADAYEGMGIYKSALKKFKEYTHIRDSVFNAEKHKQIAEMQTRYESEKKDKEIKLLENKQKMDRMQLYAIGIILLLFIVIGVFIYSRQKSKLKRDREIMEKNKLIHEAQKKLVEIEKKEKNRLKEELNNKNMELTNFALHIIHKNELIQDLKNTIKELKGKDGAERNKCLNELILKLNQTLKTNNELYEFQQHVEKVNYDYFYKLNQKFPELTENEKRLSALLRLNLSSKEIASLNNISIKAVEMGRYRLRKKLGLDKTDNLSKFLQQL